MLNNCYGYKLFWVYIAGEGRLIAQMVTVNSNKTWELVSLFPFVPNPNQTDLIFKIFDTQELTIRNKIYFYFANLAWKLYEVYLYYPNMI